MKTLDKRILETEIRRVLRKKKRTLAVAESCTGGLVSHRITNVPGSSVYFKGGVIAYSNEIKTSLLEVPSGTIKKYGAVSREVVRAMTEGARRIFKADIAAGVTGIAGPGGGSPKKPAGLAFICVASNKGAKTRKVFVKGVREAVKFGFSQAVLELIREFVVGSSRG